MAGPKEFERRIDDPQLLLVGKLAGYGPVQAEGTVAGNPFYFWARYDTWRFSISDDPEVDPVDIEVPESGEQYGFFAEAIVPGGPYEASYLPYDDAEQIIKDCCRQYLAARGLVTGG